MYAEDQSRYSPACRSTEPGACSRCTLAYDCRTKGDNSLRLPWPLIGLAMLIVMAVVLN